MARMQNAFTTVRSEGSLLPADFLQRLLSPKADIEGLRPDDYHLAGRERIDDAVSRSWLRLLGVWAAFRDQLGRVPEGDAATTATREKWLYVLFGELGYGRLSAAKGIAAEGKPYPISHVWRAVPLHLVGANVDIDKRKSGTVGAATMSPHGLVQELLNRSDDYLWGVVSNGRVLRVLRDNAAMTRQAFVEFDLEGMFEGQEYADFVLLWMLLHESRLEADRPESCWLEKWVATSRAQGTRALDSLRDGVEAAISALGTGLVSNRHNALLKEALRNGEVSKQDLYRQVLRVVYRLIFLLAIEDRDLVFAPATTREVKERYLAHYSVSRIRRLAGRRRGDTHGDVWQQLLVTFRLFGEAGAGDAIGVPFLGGLFQDTDPLLSDSHVSNLCLLEAMRALSTVSDGKTRRRVDYRNMGAEELGSIYESLLEQHPDLNLDTGSFSLGTAAGSERKTTGSYYTPSPLISLLLDSALDPVLEERIAAARREKLDLERAILDMKICDPACGSGHFLIAAAHRIARHLAQVATGDDEPSPSAQRQAMRDVVSHCIYGVDINPMAVELAKVGLWLEAIEPGKPLTFLDHHLKRGNSLLGATPALIERGIIDEAFNPIEGDDKRIAASYKARNKAARGGQMDLLAAEEPVDYGTKLAEELARIDATPDETPDQLARKESLFRKFSGSAEYSAANLVADAYCAAFVWPAVGGAPLPVTQSVLEGLRERSVPLREDVAETVREIAESYEWFHWHLQFPDVFRADSHVGGGSESGWNGGFDCVVGNPPWERIKLQEKEFFAERDPRIAGARNAAERKHLIEALGDDNPELLAAFSAAKRTSEGESHFVRDSGRYPLNGRGDINTYAVFTELSRQAVSPLGMVGLIVPTGIATDDTTKHFFREVVESGSLVSLYDFENAAPIFPAVHRSYKFSLLTLSGAGRPRVASEFAFFLHHPAQVADADRRFVLTPEDIALMNPNTRTCPVFRSARDADITRGVYRLLPPLSIDGSEDVSEWGAGYMRLIDMGDHSASLHFNWETADLEAGPVELYEGKMIHSFDHRFATFDGVSQSDCVAGRPRLPSAVEKADTSFEAQPRYFVDRALFDTLRNRYSWIEREWLLVWRDVCRSTDERTCIAAAIPFVAASRGCPALSTSAGHPPFILLAAFNSFALDFVCRQKVGGIHLNWNVMSQLPVPPRLMEDRQVPWCLGKTIGHWVGERVVELVYTSNDMAPFARDLGYDGPPFTWNDERRFEVRCELDAAFFRFYGIKRDDADYIMDTFWIVKADDEKRFGEYRTKRRIIELYDQYSEALLG